MSGAHRRSGLMVVTFGVALAATGALTLPARAIAADAPAAAPPAASSSVAAPASQASPARLPGKMVFAALLTPDLVAAEKFYTDLFRWQFQNAYVGDRLIGQASFNGRTIAAIVQKPLPKDERPAWRSFLSTADVDATTALAVQHGATILVQPHDLAAIGRDALLADPQGAVFGLLTAATADPPDIAAIPGEWIWSTLVAPDPAAEAAFYKTVLAYDTFDPADPQDPGHIILESNNFARASVNRIPTDHPVAHPRWISYLRVTDIAATAARATTLGAQVVVPPHDDPNGGTVALIADPAGALFGLLQWQDDPASDAASAGDAK